MHSTQGDFLSVITKIPKEQNMKVPAYIIGNKRIYGGLGERTINQLKNVASLPGIVKGAYLMPDGHEGYGFPIGGVAAFDSEQGIISPGGVGYDINCGVRVYTLPFSKQQVIEKANQLSKLLFKNVPSGVGSKSRIHLKPDELKQAVEKGVDWAIEQGYGTKRDKEFCEENGAMKKASSEFLTQKAIGRGLNQLGTLGAGNHFLEVQEISQVFSEEYSEKIGLNPNHCLVMIHCGSRGFGHQICDDSIRQLRSDFKPNELVDMELVYAPLNSEKAQQYLGSMRAAVNYAFLNRHIIGHFVRKTFSSVFGEWAEDEIKLVYDVCHNIAKFEEHKINGETRKLCVHRKGATRAFPAKRKELPSAYYNIGQPVLIPGSMGTSSYILIGMPKSLELAFGSSAHGAGRVMSRRKAIKLYNNTSIMSDLSSKNIKLMAKNNRTISEEAPLAYKDVDEVIDSIVSAGISQKIVQLKPLIVIKG